jgi:hypothetical protein
VSRTATACAVVLLLAGCSSMGPATVTRDRFDYVAAISESWKQQMLLNLLKVRYDDGPVFLDVTSVINAYGLETQVQLFAQSVPLGRQGDNYTHTGGIARYSDRPTISYVPVSGERLVRSLMTPVSLATLLRLVQAGQPIDTVMRFCVSAVNDIENAHGGPTGHAGNPRFAELARLLREEQAAGSLTLRSGADWRELALVLQPRPGAARAARQARIAELLGAGAGKREFRVVYGAAGEGGAQVALETRSMLQVMGDFASYIEAPAEDVAEGRVHAPERSAEQLRLFPPLVRVRHADAAPLDAHVAVRYRERAFWIDDRDRASKASLNFLMVMFSLTETGAAPAGPVVTVPAR